MKEYSFISHEAKLCCKIIELYRDGFYEYYVLTPYTSDLYFSFGVKDQFTESALYTLWRRGYFDNIIRDAQKEL